MYTIFLLSALGMAGGFKLCFYKNKEGTSDYINPTLGAIACTGLGAILGTFIAFWVVEPAVPRKDVVYGPAKLVAIRSQDSLSGSFIFGYGSISSDSRYNFVQRMDDGRMVPGSVPADGRVQLIEDPELKNTGSWSTTISEPDKSSPLYPWSIGAEINSRTVRQEFRVPVGTMVKQFNIE
jgi:hypothetical protein